MKLLIIGPFMSSINECLDIYYIIIINKKLGNCSCNKTDK